jgi:hypothetical protein
MVKSYIGSKVSGGDKSDVASGKGSDPSKPMGRIGGIRGAIEKWYGVNDNSDQRPQSDDQV